MSRNEKKPPKDYLTVFPDPTKNRTRMPLKAFEGSWGILGHASTSTKARLMAERTSASSMARLTAEQKIFT